MNPYLLHFLAAVFVSSICMLLILFVKMCFKTHISAR